MAGEIKGITIELNGDTTKLGKALADIQSEGRKVTSSLRDIEKTLKFNPGNTELVAQQQKKLQDAIENTKDKLKILTTAQEQMQSKMGSADFNEEAYEELQREIIKTSSQLDNYGKRLEASKSEQTNFETGQQNIARVLSESGRSIDDFADVVGSDFVESFKKGEGSSEAMDKALRQIMDSMIDTKGKTELLDQAIDAVGKGQPFDELKSEAESAAEALYEIDENADEADKSLKKMNSTSTFFEGLDSAVELFGKLSDAIGSAADSVMDAWAKIDEGQDTIIAKTGATGAAAEEMGEIYNRVYGSMPAESKVVGEAIGELNTQFGLQGTALEDATRYLLKYTEVNGSQATPAIQSVKAAMDQFGLSADDLSHVLDVVTQAGQATGVQTEQLLNTITRGAPVLQDMGLSFEESATLLSQLEQSGVSGSRALSYLTQAQSVATDKEKTLNEALSEFNQVANSSASDADKLTAAYDLFGTKGANKMLQAAEDGRLNFENLSAAVSDAGGTVSDTYEAMIDPIDQVQVAQQNLDLALGEVGTTVQNMLSPAINGAVGFIQGLVSAFLNLDPNVQTAIVTIGAIAAAFVAVVAVVATAQTAFTMFAPIIASMGAIFSSVGTAISGVFGIIAANPIILIIGGIIAAIALLIANWDTVRAAAQNLWNALVTIWQGICDSIANFVMSIPETISSVWDSITQTAQNVWNGIKDFIASIWDGITQGISNAITTIQTTVSTIFNAIGTTIGNIFTNIRSTVSSVWNSISSAISGVVNGISSTISSVFNGVSSTVSSIFNSIKSTVESVWNGIKEAISTPINAAKDLVKSAIDSIKGFFNFEFKWPKIPLPHFSFSGSLNPFSGNFPPKIGLSWYAKGGIFDKPSIIGVGEAGSEAVVPTNKLDQFFDEALKRVGAQHRDSDRDGVTINIAKVEVREESDIDKIAKELYRLMERDRRVKHV